MKVALLQLSSTDDKRANLEQAKRVAHDALISRPDMIVFPEVWTYQGGTVEGARASAEVAGEGEAYRWMQSLARDHRIVVHGGSINERAGDQTFNTSFVFDATGREQARYRKIHLFDMLASDGAVYRESALYGPGRELATFDVGGVRVGCTICYDLRFAELFIALAARKVDVIVVPAAFTLMTGLAHWETLLRARAIETQCYVLAPNQVGAYTEGGEVRVNFGNSMVVGPWGHVIARAQDNVGHVVCELDLGEVQRVRSRMPVQHHRILSITAP